MPVKYIIFLCLFSASVFLTGCMTITYFDPDSDFEVSPQFKKENDRYLFYAVKNSDLKAANDYLSKKANPNVCDNMGQTALMWACWNGNVRVVETLFENKKGVFTPKVNPNAVNIFGYNALLCAAYAGRFDIIKILINYNADLFNKGKIEITEEGTKKYPDTFITDNSGENILHKIVKSNNFEAFKSFLTYCSKQKIYFNEKPFLDALINEKNKEGYTPLHFAVLKKNPDMVKLLLESGANPNEAAKIGDSTIAPLYSAYNERDYAVFLELLCSENINLSIYSPKKENEQYILLTDLMQKDLSQISIYEIPFFSEEGPIEKKFIETFEKRRDYAENSLAKINLGIRDAIIDSVYKEILMEFYSAVEENKPLNEIKQLGSKLAHFGLSGVDSGKQKRIYELAIDNENEELVKYLLSFRTAPYRNDIYSDDLLQYLLSSTVDDVRWKIDMITYLVQNADQFSGKVKVNRRDDKTGESVHMKLLASKEIRATLSWDELESLLDVLERQQINLIETTSDSGEIIFNYICAENRSDYEHRNNLFDYMLKKVNGRVLIGRGSGRGTPLLSYLFEQKYYYGVEKILEEKSYCKKLEVYSAISDERYNGKAMRFYEVLLQALENAGNMPEQIARITRYKEIYLDYYPNDRPVTENLW